MILLTILLIILIGLHVSSLRFMIRNGKDMEILDKIMKIKEDIFLFLYPGKDRDIKFYLVEGTDHEHF